MNQWQKFSIQYEHSTKQKHIEISLHNLEAHVFLFKYKGFGGIKASSIHL